LVCEKALPGYITVSFNGLLGQWRKGGKAEGGRRKGRQETMGRMARHKDRQETMDRMARHKDRQETMDRMARHKDRQETMGRMGRLKSRKVIAFEMVKSGSGSKC